MMTTMLWMTAVPSPPAWKVAPLVDVRLRYERRVNRDLSDAANDDSTLPSFRARVGFEARDDRHTVARFVFQHTRSQDRKLAGTTSAQTFDTLELNVAVPWEGGTATLGRQRFKIGDSRLFGMGDWSVKSRSWDGVRFSKRPWDGFVGQLGVATTQNVEARVGFVAYESAVGESMLAHKQDTRPAQSVANWTLDHRVVLSQGRFEMPFEGAFQVGRQNGRSQRAFMVSAKPTWTIRPGLAGYVQGDLASGGQTAGTSRLFDQLYASLTTALGWSESVGQRNIRALAVGVDWKPRKDLELRARWHRYDLFDRRDGWYAASGSLVRRPGGGTYVDPAGASGTHIGDELGVIGTWSVDRHSSLQGGFSVLAPGTFVKSMNGGPASRQVWGYLAFQYRF